MHLSTVGQLAHPADDGGRRAGRHRDRNSDQWTLSAMQRAIRQWRSTTIREWREGRVETLGNRSDLGKGIHLAPRRIVYDVNLFVLRIAATPSRCDFEIIPATSSWVCCGDNVATFCVATRALFYSIHTNFLLTMYYIKLIPYLSSTSCMLVPYSPCAAYMLIPYLPCAPCNVGPYNVLYTMLVPN